MPHDLTGAGCLLPDDLEIAPQGRRRGLVHHQLDGSDDGLQGVVDLVRHSGHELANGGQAFAVHELIAEAQLFGRVTLDTDIVRDRSGRLAEADNSARRRKRGPVVAAPDQRAAPDPTLLDGRSDLAIDAFEFMFHQIGQAEVRKLLP